MSKCSLDHRLSNVKGLCVEANCATYSYHEAFDHCSSMSQLDEKHDRKESNTLEEIWYCLIAGMGTIIPKRIPQIPHIMHHT